MHKALSVILIIVGALLGPLFLRHFLALVTNAVGWAANGDWLSLGKRALTTFVLGALGYKSLMASRRRLNGEVSDAAT